MLTPNLDVVLPSKDALGCDATGDCDDVSGELGCALGLGGFAVVIPPSVLVPAEAGARLMH